MSELKTQLKTLFATTNPREAATSPSGATEVLAPPVVQQQAENYLPIMILVGSGVLLLWAMMNNRRSAEGVSPSLLAQMETIEPEEENGQDYAYNY